MKYTLKEVKAQFVSWRAHKQSIREPIPPSLWELAVGLIPRYPKTKVCRTLGLNFTAFKEHQEQYNLPTIATPQNFVEVSLSPKTHFPLSTDCDRVEVEKRDGSRLSLYAKEGQSLDGVILLKTFLGVKDASDCSSK